MWIHHLEKTRKYTLQNLLSVIHIKIQFIFKGFQNSKTLQVSCSQAEFVAVCYRNHRKATQTKAIPLASGKADHNKSISVFRKQRNVRNNSLTARERDGNSVC